MLRFRILETLPEAEHESSVLERMDDIVAWREVPAFTKMGRTGALVLDTPLVIETDHGPRQIHTLKIKGVGLCDHRDDVRPPTTKEYFRIHPHLGFTRDGEFVSVLSAPAPLGGITTRMARAEYEIGERLLRAGCPSQIPLRLYRYEEPDLVFRPEGYEPLPLGVVISGVPVHRFVRANKIFSYSQDDATRSELDLWAQSLEVVGESQRDLALIREVGRLYARVLRLFHEAGFYRYSGQPDNYAYAVATEEVFLIDLDSSRNQGECSARELPLQLMRDVASALYGITTYMLRRSHIDRFTPAQIRRSRLYLSLLLGYYHDVPASLLEEVAERLELHFERIYEEALRRHAATPIAAASETSPGLSYVEYRKNRRQQYWIYREETFVFFEAALWDPYEATTLGVLHPHRLSKE